jgi:hypothetical protein
MLGRGRQRLVLGGALGEPADERLDGVERRAALLVRERDDDLGGGVVGQRLDQRQLDGCEVVEPVDEHGAAAPALGPGAERLQCVPGVDLVVDQAGPLVDGAVGAVDRGDLVRVGAPRAVAGPGGERLTEPLGRDHRALELADQAVGRAHEARPPGRAGEHLEPRLLDRPLDDQLALEPARQRGAERLRAAALGDDLEQPSEADHARAEDRAALGQLALSVLDVAEGGNHEHGLGVEGGPVAAEDDPCLARVGGPRDQLERHPSHSGTAIRRRARPEPRTPRYVRGPCPALTGPDPVTGALRARCETDQGSDPLKAGEVLALPG